MHAVQGKLSIGTTDSTDWPASQKSVEIERNNNILSLLAPPA